MYVLTQVTELGFSIPLKFKFSLISHILSPSHCSDGWLKSKLRLKYFWELQPGIISYKTDTVIPAVALILTNMWLFRLSHCSANVWNSVFSSIRLWPPNLSASEFNTILYLPGVKVIAQVTICCTSWLILQFALFGFHTYNVPSAVKHQRTSIAK